MNKLVGPDGRPLVDDGWDAEAMSEWMSTYGLDGAPYMALDMNTAQIDKIQVVLQSDGSGKARLIIKLRQKKEEAGVDASSGGSQLEDGSAQ